jgi:hypothetical protein
MEIQFTISDEAGLLAARAARNFSMFSSMLRCTLKLNAARTLHGDRFGQAYRDEKATPESGGIVVEC